MADATEIQWTDSTWNVVTGCTRVSPGCARCYIERTPPFRMSGRRFATIDGESSTGVTLHWDRLTKPPRGPKVFTPSLGDLFHEAVPAPFVRDAFDAMRLFGDRTFQVLTKRPERARDLYFAGVFTLPENVWLGVSIENARYTWRADVLREIPAAVRFISAEPLLGSLFDGDRPGICGSCNHSTLGHGPNGCDTEVRDYGEMDCGCQRQFAKPLDLTGIDWIIVGESGPGARPFHLEHAREILAAARYGWDGVPRREMCDPRELGDEHRPAVFVKQLGARPRHFDDVTIGVYEEKPLRLRDAKGGDWSEWPTDLRVREFPSRSVPVSA